MKVVILSGGLGTRISEETSRIPKPMVQIGGIPILVHIIKHYASYGCLDFIIACGYKQEVIKDYFINYRIHNSDIRLQISNTFNQIFYLSQPENNLWNVLCADTGLETLTSGRLKKVSKYITGNTFFVTYGDGVSNININDLLDYHRAHGKIATITAIKSPGRFGALQIEGNQVVDFKEKTSSYINGGFMVFNKEIFDYLDDDMLEKFVLPKLARDNQLMAYPYDGFWHCMDTIADKEVLEKLWKEYKSWSNITF